MCRSQTEHPPHGKRCITKDLSSPAMKAKRDAHNARRRARYHASRGQLELECPFGTKIVKDGDLTDVETRTLLISGLCGTLAKSIVDKTGGDVYLVVWNKDPNEPFTAESFASSFEEDPSILEYSTHIMVASESVKGNYMDAFGHRTLEDIRDFYGSETQVIQGTTKMLEKYALTDQPLPKFADSVIALDSQKFGYDYKTSYL